jgi:hypothetical protein
VAGAIYILSSEFNGDAMFWMKSELAKKKSGIVGWNILRRMKIKA